MADAGNVQPGGAGDPAVDTALPPTPAAAPQAALVSGQGSQCPHEYLCPITGVLMREPVMLVETGHSFEKWAIEQWFAQGKSTCPLTGIALTSIQVSPNLTLRKLIQDWTACHPTHSEVRKAQSSTGDLHPQPSAGPAVAVVLPVPHGLQPRPQRAPRAARHIGRFLMGGARPQGPESPLPAAADDDEPLDAHTPAIRSEGQEGESSAIDAPPTLSLAAEFEAIGPLPRELLVLAHVAAPDTGKRVPVDLVAVLDVSGSMAGDRLALVKETMLFVISQLQPSDRLSVVAFDDRAQRAIRLTRATNEGKERLRVAVQGLTIGGGTSIAAGLTLGLHVLTSRRERNHVACMFLLSDGQDNLTGSGSFAENNRDLLTSATREGVAVHTFGYGRDHDDQILDSIAEGTNGTFTFVRNNAEVKEAVAQTLGGALSVAVQATTIELTAASGVAVLSVSAGAYAATVDGAQASAKVELKDMYSGEIRDVLIRVKAPAAEGGQLVPTELLSGLLQYTVPGGEVASRSPLVTLSVARREAAEGSGPNVDVDIQRNRLTAVEAMREADELAGEGHLELARAAIASAIDAIRRSVSAQAPACVATLEDLQQVGRGLASALEYRTEGAKAAKSSCRMHSTQRATYSSAGAQRNAEYAQYSSASAMQMRRAATESAQMFLP